MKNSSNNIANDIDKIIKMQRATRWVKFDLQSADEKLEKLEKIIQNKKITQCHLAINLRFPESNFDSIIFALISKAQSTPENYYRLMLAFPEYVRLWEEWQDCENEQEFFKKYNV